MNKCKHADECGGCKTQHIEYENQLKEKQDYVEMLFCKNNVSAIVASDDLWNFRGKMEFTFSQDRDGKKFLGLFMAKVKRKVVNLSECLISPPFVGPLLDKVRSWWEGTDLVAYKRPFDKGALQTLTVRSGLNQMIILTVSGDNEFALSNAELESFIKAVKINDDTSIYMIVKTICEKKVTQFREIHLFGPKYLKISLCGVLFHVTPQSFFQPNVKAAEKMINSAINSLKLDGSENVLDLYCGVGTIGIILSKFVSQVVGVEINSGAVVDANENIKRNCIKNMRVYQGDVKERLNEVLKIFTPDIIVIDPPRTGLDNVSKDFIKKIMPKKILYISCNPDSQKEDINYLTNYQIEAILPFDQFPHTLHIENVILLKIK